MGDIVVFAGGHYVLLLQGEKHTVVLVGLPEVGQVGIECEGEVILFQLGILHCKACIALLAATLSVI